MTERECEVTLPTIPTAVSSLKQCWHLGIFNLIHSDAKTVQTESAVNVKSSNYKCENGLWNVATMDFSCHSRHTK